MACSFVGAFSHQSRSTSITSRSLCVSSIPSDNANLAPAKQAFTLSATRAQRGRHLFHQLISDA